MSSTEKKREMASRKEGVRNPPKVLPVQTATRLCG